MLTVPFRHAVMTLTDRGVQTIFSDGVVNEMHFAGVDTEDQRLCARIAGYGDDWRRYTVEHDATHLWLADRLWKTSLAIHDPLNCSIADAPYPYKHEEHMVNMLQRQVRTGVPDEFEVLDAVFGDELRIVVIELRNFLAEIG